MTALSELRRNPIDGSISWRNMDIEGHTVAELDQLPGIYGFRLQDRPRNTGLVVAETGTGGATAFTLVTTTPTGANQAYIDYDSGLVIVHSVHNGDFLEVTYQGAGSIVSIDLISDGTDLLTAAGDLITRNATELEKFAIGPNGYILSVDTSVATKLAWIAHSTPTNVRERDRVPSNAADTDHDITFSAGQFWGSDGILYSVSAITKQIDAAWAEGTNAGGIDTGAVANNTWYYAHEIRQDSSGDMDVIFSTASTSGGVTMPSGWTHKRVMDEWLFRTDGSANFRGMKYHSNGWMVWKSPPQLDFDTTTLSTTRTNATILAPTGTWEIKANCVINHASALRIVYISNPDLTDIAPDVATAVGNFRCGTDNAARFFNWTGFTDGSAQVSGVSDGASTTFRFKTRALRKAL